MCDLNKPKNAVTVKVVSIKGKCKYHKIIGQEYNLEQIAPSSMCLDAFHVVYPYGLSLTYGASFSWMEDKDSVIAQCPNKSNTVTFKIRRIRLTEKKVRIEIEVIDTKGGCRKKHRIGDKFIMNLGDFPEICPAAFDEIFPYIQILRFGGRVGWEESGKVFVQCSDHLNTVTYQLIKEKA